VRSIFDKTFLKSFWVKALAVNIIGEFKECLDEKYHKMTAGTIVRLDRPAMITTTADEIVLRGVFQGV